MRAFAIVALFTSLAASADIAAAELTVNRLFSDHMVLQREKPVPVWGTADADSTVKVTFGDQTISATADAKGQWTATLAAMDANATSRQLNIQGADGSAVVINDVLVGEVWLGSGQSNMAMHVSRSNNFEDEKAASNLPLIRVFTEKSTASPQPTAQPKGTWSICSPETVGSYSATLFFFGRELHHELDVPVGLIASAVGGTSIEKWIDADTQLADSKLRAFTERENAAYANFDAAKEQAKFEAAHARWKETAKKAKAAGKPVPRAPRNLVDQRRAKGAPGHLFNAKIAPLIPYAIRGAVWYQGEANSHSLKEEFYQYHLPLLVNDWRARWNDNFPFAWVQLPNYIRAGEGWSMVREAMLKSTRLPNTGMAITIDVGDPKDIHPKNKQAVGRRLALWALGDVYDRDVPATSGPRPTGQSINGSKVVVTFDHTAEGLELRGDAQAAFEIAGADGEWRPATATIKGSTVIISNDDVPNPTTVRYAWTSNPEAVLFNSAGLPASPFRTNGW